MNLLFTLLNNQFLVYTLFFQIFLQTAYKYLLLSLSHSLPAGNRTPSDLQSSFSSLLYVWNKTFLTWIMSASQLYGTLTKYVRLTTFKIF